MPSYSPSRLSTYENCPLKYKFQYVDRIKRDTEGIEAFLGSRVHETLEKLYSDLKYRKENTLEDLLGSYDDLWKKEWDDNVKITREEYEPDHYYQTGADCIRSYYERYHPFDQAKTIGIERRLSTSLDGSGEYKVAGIADRIDKMTDGTYEIHDYKTSSSLPEQAKMDEDRQLALYHLMLKDTWDGVHDVALVWHYLAFDEELRSFRSDEQLDEVAQHAVEIIQRIERAEAQDDWPAEETALCDWCDYPHLCPRRKHLVQVEDLPPKQYLEDSGVQLVDEFAKWHERAKEAKDELAKVKEAVIAYARGEGLELIKGSRHKLRVTTSAKLKFPAKAHRDRERLEQLLRDIGKWEETSTLDTSALAKAMQNGHWDDGLLQKLGEFSAKENSHSVSLSKLKEEEER